MKRIASREFILQCILPSVVLILIGYYVHYVNNQPPPPPNALERAWSFIFYGGHSPSSPPPPPPAWYVAYEWPAFVLAALIIPFLLWQFPVHVPFFNRLLYTPHILVIEDILVTFEISPCTSVLRAFFRYVSAEEKITTVLKANPNADLKPLEGALGVKILNVQRKEQDNKTTGVWI